MTDPVLGQFEDKLLNEIKQLALLVSEGFFRSVKEDLLSLTVPQVPLNNVRFELRPVVAALQLLIDANFDQKMAAIKSRYRFTLFHREYVAELHRRLDEEYVLLHDRR